MQLSFDLHLHSCLSPCGSDEMTPANIAGMCALAGLDAVALTDHNTAGNCRAFCRAAEEYGLLALGGMELTTEEEVHVVCLFPGPDEAEAFGELVASRLPPLENDPSIFGPQILMDEKDGVLGEDRHLLSGATSIGVYEAAALAASFGGFAVPAHIDRPSFSLLAALGLWDPDMGFPLAEVSRYCPPDLFDRPDLRGVPHITGCDAHDLNMIPDAHQFLTCDEKNGISFLTSLRDSQAL